MIASEPAQEELCLANSMAERAYWYSSLIMGLAFNPPSPAAEDSVFVLGASGAFSYIFQNLVNK